MLQIKNTLGGGKPEGLYVWKKCENDTDHTFIDYVVSDKETAYPDGGEKGGYWYEKYKAIVKKVTGSFSGSYYTSSYTINHNGNMDVIGVWTSGSSGSYSLGMAIVGSDEIGFEGFEANGYGAVYSPSLTIIDENTCKITYGNSYGPNNSTVNYYIYGIARE